MLAQLTPLMLRGGRIALWLHHRRRGRGAFNQGVMLRALTAGEPQIRS
ncbi:hypothetical protein [Bradyrhizobium prioriisuperbiae]|nr:hypothetical protein [Bradyrhizobium prioritasuperba]